MSYFKNNPSILDSSSCSRSFSFLVCKIILSSLSLSCFKRLVSASISSVPLKAEINQERRCAQRERQQAPVEDGEGDSGDGDGIDVSIKPKEGGYCV